MTPLGEEIYDDPKAGEIEPMTENHWGGEMSILVNLALGVFVLVFVILGAVGLIFLRMWFQGVVCHADVSLVELIGMACRKVNPKVVLEAKILARNGGLVIEDKPDSRNDLAISTRKLERHFLAGGHVTEVIRAMLAAKQANLDLSFPQACEIDLSGRDVLDEVRRRLDSKSAET